MFFGKPLRLSFAKKVSDVIAKLKGSFDDNIYVKRQEEKKKGVANKELKK